MTLAGGRFGPSFKTEHTEKEWGGGNLGKRDSMKRNQRILKYAMDFDMLYWIVFHRYYPTDYSEED